MPGPRVLFLVHLPPPVHGVSVMNRSVLDSDVVRENVNCDIIPLRFATSIHDLEVFRFGKLWTMAQTVLCLLKKLTQFKPQAVYFTMSPSGGAFWRDCFFAAIIKSFGVKIVYHLHAKCIKKRVKYWLQRIICEWVFDKSILILLSPLLYPDVSEVGARVRVCYVPNGIEKTLDDASFQKIMEDRRNKEPSKAVGLVFLSHMMVSKGPLVLVEASQIVLEKGLRFKVHFIGDWFDLPCKEQFYRLVHRYRLEGSVEWHGPMFGDEKNAFLEKMDILAHPTCEDAFPLAILEAMQYGLPVVSTCEGAIPEIVDEGETGFLVPKLDPERLADRIEVLIKDSKLRQEMGMRGREKFLSHYTVQMYEKRVVNSILELGGFLSATDRVL